ncbi:hypothetical protein BC473_09380 [Neisseria meningitidis]|nr:hypothetical protein BC473_09380 [Neisseria meningitidis]
MVDSITKKVSINPFCEVRIMSDSFENSPEYDDWIESGGRDEDYE